MTAPIHPLTFRCDDCRRTFTQAGAMRPGPIYCPHCGGRGYEEAEQPRPTWRKAP